MIEVQNWSDVLALEKQIDNDLYIYIEARFRTLHQSYCASEKICLSLSEFSLADYGAIVLVQSYEELKPLIIETAWIQSLKNYDLYEACKAQLLTMISKKDDFSKRAANMLSVIILTAKYVNDALDLGLDVDNIANLLVELDSKQNRDIGMQALEVLHQYTVSHANAFLRQTGKSNSRSNSDLFSCNTIGTYSCLNGEIEIAVLKSELPHILNQFGFSNPDVVLAHWKAQGILSCDADRFTRIRKINGAPVPVNVVKFNPTMG